MHRWPAGRGLPPLDGQKQESGRESGRVAKKSAGGAVNRLSASGGRNRNRATESDKARIGRTESDRAGRKEAVEESCPEAECVERGRAESDREGRNGKGERESEATDTNPSRASGYRILSWVAESLVQNPQAWTGFSKTENKRR